MITRAFLLFCLVLLATDASKRELEALTPAAADTGNPVVVEWITPFNGATVSNTITLTASAGSAAAPIARVEFYDVFTDTNGVKTTNLFAVRTNTSPTPQNLIVY